MWFLLTYKRRASHNVFVFVYVFLCVDCFFARQCYSIIATVTCNMYNLMLLNFPNIMCKRFFLAMRLYLKKITGFFLLILSIILCKKYCKFRTGNVKLPIETGRWSNIPKDNIICKLCDCNKIRYYVWESKLSWLLVTWINYL